MKSVLFPIVCCRTPALAGMNPALILLSAIKQLVIIKVDIPVSSILKLGNESGRPQVYLSTYFEILLLSVEYHSMAAIHLFAKCFPQIIRDKNNRQNFERTGFHTARCGCDFFRAECLAV